jgi:Fe-S oxidoreductase
MKIVLLSCPAADSPEALPLGAASVAAAIKKANAVPGAPRLEPLVLEAGLGEDPASLARRALAGQPDVVGLSVYSWSKQTLCETARLVRSASPNVLIFAGGPEVTADPERALAELCIDFAVAGEGESATAAAIVAVAARGMRGGLVDADALSDIAGVALPGRPWRRAPAEDPAALPSPWLMRTIRPEDCGGDVVWELSRGCPFKCAYCYESKGSPGSRPFPMRRVEAELDLFIAAGVSYAFILDPTFDSDPERACEVLDLLIRKAPGMRWKFEVRAELLDKAIVKRFSQLDCSLQIGLQSARPETLAAIGRPGFDRKAFTRKIAALGQAGVSFGLDLIYALPGDRLSDFRDSVDFAVGLEPNHLDVFPLALLPGTDLADRAAELGIDASHNAPYLVRSTREMPSGDLEKARLLALGCDRFYSAGRAVGWFSAAMKSLRARPSELFESYAAWLEARSPGAWRDGAPESSHAEIEAEQLGFLEERFERAGLAAQLPALRDLVRLHGAYGRALAEGAETALDLSYDPEEVLVAPELGLALFAREASASPAAWRIVPDENEGARIESARGKPRGQGGPGAA